MENGSAPWGGRYILLGQKAFRIWRHDGLRALLSRTSEKILRKIGFGPGMRPEDYRTWIADNEPNAEALHRQRHEALAFRAQPLISIVTPVFNPPAKVLRATLESVLQQTYGNWELCLVDGGSSANGVRQTLETYSRQDSRIKVKFLEKNLGISGNTNEALARAHGEFIAFLDHDDLLAPDMLFEIVRRVNEKPQTDIVYFDDDKITADGNKRYEPLFKPDWAPEMLISLNYLAHAVVRRTLVERIGGLNPNFDGAQDWDFMFRCTEKTEAVEHVAKVLYHWRAIPGSCAGALTAKPYAVAKQLQAVADHLGRQGVANAKVITGSSGEIRAVWPAKPRKVSIIVPTKDKVGFVKKCLASLLERTTYNDFEIILVDNGSKEKATHNYYQALGREPRVRIINYNAPFNYSHANNLGARHAHGELLLFLNNDTEALVPDWLYELARWAERPKIGVVGAKLLYPDSTIQHAGLVIGMDGQVGPVFQGVNNDHQGIFGSVQWYRNYTTVSAACMMIPRWVFDQVGGFDENYLLAHSDVEICLRIADLGLRVVYTPFAVLRHYEGRTRFNHVPLEDHQLAYQQMQQRVAAGDPYFNPNLSYLSAIPKLKEKSEEDRLLRLQRFLRESGVTQCRAKSA